MAQAASAASKGTCNGGMPLPAAVDLALRLRTQLTASGHLKLRRRRNGLVEKLMHTWTKRALHCAAVADADVLASLFEQEKERLAQMVEELNDIVFSKTFKAPSAWADRERKYKMEARDWDVEVWVFLWSFCGG